VTFVGNIHEEIDNTALHEPDIHTTWLWCSPQTKSSSIHKQTFPFR